MPDDRAAHPRVSRHESALGSWEYALGRPHPSLRAHVHEYAGWVEQMVAPLVRSELPTEVVPVIINFGAPVRLSDQQNPSRWTDYGSFSTGAYDTYVLVGSTGPSAGVQVNLSILGARLFLGRPLRTAQSRRRARGRLRVRRAPPDPEVVRRAIVGRALRHSRSRTDLPDPDRSDALCLGAVRLVSPRRDRRPRQHRRDRERCRL